MSSSKKASNIISVELRKREVGGLGFLVREKRGQAPVLVSEIIQGGAADDSGLVELGDLVLAVNGRSLVDVDYQTALLALRDVKSGNKAHLILRAPRGFSARLETTFDSRGKAKTIRVTEPLDIRAKSKTFSNILSDSRTTESSCPYKTTEVISEATCNCFIPQPDTLKTIVSRREEHNCSTNVIEKPPISRISTNPRDEEVQVLSNTETSAATEASSRILSATDMMSKPTQNHEENDVVDGTVIVRKTVVDLTTVHQDKIVSKDVEKVKIVTPKKTSSDETPTFAKLLNWESGERVNDTLHLKSRNVGGCTRNKCIGSVMNPDHMTLDPRKGPKTEEEKLFLATDFIKQYYGAMKRKNVEAEKKRLAEVVESIKTTGTYQLTEYELTFGAKAAWRNAPRCIGRIQWNKLQVFDYRHVQNTAQMFEAICNQLKYATNKGNIRSSIAFFPQRTDYKKEFRVWNSQYIRYAAYKQPDGSIIGDPVNLEFTELCEKLGWKGNGGRFDVLPLLLQANGDDPELYEVPKELVLEVQLRHPKFPWFKDLGYKWYAVPAVSNMMLDIGGIEFCAAPFNGWFMGTEIGRDLCDTVRYNVLEEVGRSMNLDTKNSSSLWKDLAFVEFNIAILHSFQSDKVTIMDHHTATESFMKHFANEQRLRGGCPGDWVWLVPPISGSLTPMFHQEILNYTLNPACLYQPDPWKYYTWKEKEIKKSKKAIRFKELAKSVFLASTMMRKAMANRVKATILYATETGKSHEYAKTLQDIFNHAFDAKVVCMEDYDVVNLEHETLVLVVCSTFGNGDPPENGESFAQLLIDMAHSVDEVQMKVKRLKGSRDFSLAAIYEPSVETWSNQLSVTTDSIIDCGRRSSLPALTDEEKDVKTRFNSIHNVTPRFRRQQTNLVGSTGSIDDFSGLLANLRFSVFGLGSRAYPHFCAFANAVDTLLGEMKGERLLEIGEGDELCGQEESFRTWAKQVFKISCETFCVGEDVSSEAASASLTGQDRSWNSKKFRINICSDDEEQPSLIESLATFHKKKLSAVTLSKRTYLQSGEDDRSTILVELDSGNAPGISYRPGDHLGIYPCNQSELVEQVLGRIQDSIDENCLIQLQILEERVTPIGVISNWVPDKRIPIMTIKTAFEKYLDITTCPSPQLLKIFANCATDDEERGRLLELSEGKAAYEEWKFHYFPNLPEVLAEFPSIHLEASLLLSQLPPLQCRYYSISSSPDYCPNQVHCTVAVVSYKIQGGSGPTHYGVCSSYLNKIEPGEKVICFIRPASSFHMPEDHSAPCLLIGPGTGIAPFRSFWQQRMYDIKNGFYRDGIRKRKGKKCGQMTLLFGCRHPDRDHLYKKEIEEAMECNAITQYHTAFSRLEGKPKQYVQHVLERDLSALAYEWVVTNGGHLYICGDVIMAADVNKTFIEVLKKEGSLSESIAKDFVSKMMTARLLHEDIFGVTLKTYEVNQNARQRQISAGPQKAS